ncbi:ribonuclease H2 subunit A [Gorgonomyces haynaldii]|nr:ribonuclease H2 subunit A [Gorgonomyces haynaldii]
MQFSEIPPECFEKPVILGVDEAGRGPVLGPMVYAVAYHILDRNDQLKQMKFNDSKQVKEEDRERLFDLLKKQDWIGYGVYCCSAQDISGHMLAPVKYNLNEFAHDTTIGMIKHLVEQKVMLSEIYIDTVGPPDKYQAKLSKIFPAIKITVSKKADALFPIVSAASICAKVTRDDIVKNWEFREPLAFSRVFGSGYPADPKTVEWMQSNMDPVFGYPRLIRFSWSTTAQLLEDKGVQVDWPTDDQFDSKRPSIIKIMRLSHVSEL